VAEKSKALLNSKAKLNPEIPYYRRMAKVLADPLRIKIVVELNMREMSPKEFFDEFGGGSLSRVAEAFKVLAEYGWIHMTRTATGGSRRSAIEHFYRATQPIMFDESWPDLPPPIKGVFTNFVFTSLISRVKDAMEAKTIDARGDRHASWMPGRVDQQGWETIIGWTDALFYRIRHELDEASERLAESGEEPISMTVALAAFESPRDTEKLP
jgi:hypothetical protein